MATQQIVKFHGKHKLEELFQQKEQLADMKVVLLTDAETTECFGQKETVEKLLQTFILQYEHEGEKSIVLRDTNGTHLGLAWKEPGKWEYKLLDRHEQTVLEKIMSHSGMVIDSPNNSENKGFDAIEWLLSQIDYADKYSIRRETRDVIYAGIKTNGENAREEIEQFFFAEHFEKGGETGPLIVTDEDERHIMMAALHEESGLLVKHWFEE